MPFVFKDSINPDKTWGTEEILERSTAAKLEPELAKRSATCASCAGVKFGQPSLKTEPQNRAGVPSAKTSFS